MRHRPVIALTLVSVLLAACAGESGSTSSTPLPEATAAAPAATATAAGPRGISGMFTEPRPSPADETRRLGPLPETFPVWNGTSTMIYDVQTNKATDLGPGSLGRFSPDSTRMVWIAGPMSDGEAWMIDLRTMERRDLGPGRLAGFVDDSHVGVTRPASNTTDVIDLGTGERTVVDGYPFYPDPGSATTPDGYALRYTINGYEPMNATYVLTDPASRGELLRFDAHTAVPAGRGSLAVATVPILVGGPVPNGYPHGTTNVFLVDIATGQATFVATGATFIQFPLAADDDYVVWTDNYCDGGYTRVYDRATKKITEVEASLWPVSMAGGLILEGAFGGRALIDPATLQYRAALPPGVGDTSWSPDHRYASLGQYGGHGGLCL